MRDASKTSRSNAAPPIASRRLPGPRERSPFPSRARDAAFLKGSLDLAVHAHGGRQSCMAAAVERNSVAYSPCRRRRRRHTLRYSALRAASVCVAPKFIAASGLIGRRLAVIVVFAQLRGCMERLFHLVIGSIPPLMGSTRAWVMLRRCGHLRRRSGNQQRAEKCESCFSHGGLQWWTLRRGQSRLASDVVSPDK